MEFKIDNFNIKIHRSKISENNEAKNKRLSLYVSTIFELGKKYMPKLVEEQE